MANYFFIDDNGDTQGPIDEQQLQELVAKRIITPTTPMSSDNGRRGDAKKILPELFNTVNTTSMLLTDILLEAIKVSSRQTVTVGIVNAVILFLILGTMWFVLWDVYSAVNSVQQTIRAPLR